MVLQERAYSYMRFIHQKDTDQWEADRQKARDNELTIFSEKYQATHAEGWMNSALWVCMGVYTAECVTLKTAEVWVGMQSEMKDGWS